MRNRNEASKKDRLSRRLLILIIICFSLTISTVIAIVIYHVQKADASERVVTIFGTVQQSKPEVNALSTNQTKSSPQPNRKNETIAGWSVTTTGTPIVSSSPKSKADVWEMKGKHSPTVPSVASTSAYDQSKIETEDERTELNITTDSPRYTKGPARSVPRHTSRPAESVSEGITQSVFIGNLTDTVQASFNSLTNASNNGCQPAEFKCNSTNDCVPLLNVCDGTRQCTDGSDERQCPCARGSYRCSSGDQCIDSQQRCDNEEDCRDGSDEENCQFFECTDFPKCSHMKQLVGWKFQEKDFTKPELGSFLRLAPASDVRRSLLILGNFNLHRHGCFAVTYTLDSRYSSLDVHIRAHARKAIASSTRLWSISGNQGKRWHKAVFQLPATKKFDLTLQMVAGLNGKSNSEVGVGSVMLSRGQCPRQNCLEEERMFSCSISKICISMDNVCDGKFDCGYLHQDFSDEMRCQSKISETFAVDFDTVVNGNFLRNIQNWKTEDSFSVSGKSLALSMEHNNRIGTFHIGKPHIGESHSRGFRIGTFQMPPVTVTNGSCLSFLYFMHSVGPSVKLDVFSNYYSDDGIQKVSIFQLIGSQGYDWQKAAINLEMANTTILLNFQGTALNKESLLFLDNLSIGPGSCPEMSCSDKYFVCQTSKQCINKENVCDGHFDCGDLDHSDEENCSSDSK